jgi:hypothetical protein
VRVRRKLLIRPLQSIPSFQIEEVEISKVILGCDTFISWLYQGGDSPFKGSDGNPDISKVLEVMKASVSYGVKCVDLSPPLIEAFVKLQDKAGEEIVGLGSLQEWTCKNLTIDDVPLANYDEKIRASVRQKLPKGYLADLAQSNMPGPDFIQSFFAPNHATRPLTQSQIDSIEMKPEFFTRRLELYRKLNVKLVQFGGIAADWLVSIGRIDLLEKLLQLIKSKRFRPILICHWTSIVLPICEKELDEVAGYIVPINKLWGLLTLQETLKTIKNIKKPIIAMKTLARNALLNDMESAYHFLFKEAGVTAVLVGVSSKIEAEQTFSTIGNVLKRHS